MDATMVALFETPAGLAISTDRISAPRQSSRRRSGVRRSLSTAAAAAGSGPRASIKKARPAGAAGGATTSTLTPARCGYRTGKCQNLQAVKRNGKLHKLCEFHREKANMNQKKLDRKKRMQRSCSRLPYDTMDESVDDGGSGRRRAYPDGRDEQSPRAIDADPLLEAMLQEEEEELDALQLEVLPILPTSLHEAPLSLGYEELAIFCSLMTMDRRPHASPYQLPFQRQFIV